MKSILIQLSIFSLLFSSCKKEPGEGGASSIRGKVFASYYNKNFSIKADSGYAPDIDVHIVYGDGEKSVYGDRVKTMYDGSYHFKFLRKGTYKIYAYSKDSTGAYRNQVNQYSPDVAIIEMVTISKNKQIIDVQDIRIVQ